ncbi:hypothetical protein EIZ39_24670 [Ammoniphilus sp. CFH 90114]|nr:hypothetical protein EIZ39_24670 [Ammoniphilus sp. CFH 90114]
MSFLGTLTSYFIEPKDVQRAENPTPSFSPSIYEDQGVKIVASVVDEDIAYYDEKTWVRQFWNGMNLGATTPGHMPGELRRRKTIFAGLRR